MSIVDNFYKKTHGSKEVVAKVNEKQRLNSALNLFNESLDAQKRTADNSSRQSDETVIQWEQRIREQEKERKYQGDNYEPLYADQYKKADYGSVQEYNKDIEETENKVSSLESNESTGNITVNDLPWTKGDSINNIEDNHKEMKDLQVNDSMLQQAVNNEIITSTEASNIRKKGKIEGINSTMWTSKPNEVEFE